MAPEQSISELAELIQKNAKILQDGTKDQLGSDFSFNFTLPPVAPKLDASLEAVRAEAVEAADELKARLLGPFLYLGTLVLPVPSLIVICACLFHFRIATHVPTQPGESITYTDLAARCGMPVDELRRVVQTAIAYRMFEEDVPDVSVKHNTVSALFGLNPGMTDLLHMLAEENPLGAMKFVEAMRRYPGSGEPGHSARMVAERSERGLSNDINNIADPTKGFFDMIASDPVRVSRFRASMDTATRAPGFAFSYFLDNVPWGDASQCPKTIVDIAGAGGDVCKQILRRYSGVEKATSVDLPEVIETCEVPEDLTGRLDFARYNFLTETMPYEADAYLFRHIFHDWSDQYASKILKNLAPALRAGTRVWINEIVFPELSATNHLNDQRQRTGDLMMKVGFNGKERSRRGWEDVFAAADKRYRIQSIVQPKGAVDAVIEVVFDA
ncbi:S-adenosyl-L-methionine-dependent methyltransferase [Xylaria arbuscula]|nr:S-adenosyl-L-methionine-dependent methyltransferase [Xylaria arbuscula]